MLDETVFEDIHEIAENSAYLKAVEEKVVCLEMLHQLPPYQECKRAEQKLLQQGKINFETIFAEPTGFYMLKCFLVSDYAVDKALFVKDVEAYRMMRFETARGKIAHVLYERFVSPEEHSFEKGSSVFDIVDEKKGKGKLPSISTKIEEDEVKEAPRDMFRTGNSNSIGVYGHAIVEVKTILDSKKYPHDLFDDTVRLVMSDLRLDVFPRFLKSEFYQRYIRTKWIEKGIVGRADFSTLRVLGRGGFGVVHACRKNNSGAIYAMKCMNKRLIRQKQALRNVLEERNVLTMMNSRFVTNLKYALQDEEQLYLLLDLMLGGDLKFHLLHEGRFSEIRARFYAAEILLGLEHIHGKGVIYRDIKLENVLLDQEGHCRITDLGLAVVTKKQIKGYAGTPGYTAPEMIRGELYGPSVDIFSLGVLIYRMIRADKPFPGGRDRDLDKAVKYKTPVFPPKFFSPEAKSLLEGMLAKRPEKRLGCDSKVGIQAIKDHPFFASIDWGLLEAGYVQPPFTPDHLNVNAAPLKDIGGFDRNRYRNIKLSDSFRQACMNFEYVSVHALQEEMVAVLTQADENTNFERFAVNPDSSQTNVMQRQGNCCVIL